MVPLGAVVDVRDPPGRCMVTRYNMFPAAAINGASLPGVSTGTCISTMEALADQELPRSMTYEWTELTYLQKQSSKIETFRDLRRIHSVPSCWARCWCSSCWRACTRAGRCRWRSFWSCRCACSAH